MGDVTLAREIPLDTEEEALACLAGMVYSNELLVREIHALLLGLWTSGVNRARLAKVLGVSRATLYRLVEETPD